MPDLSRIKVNTSILLESVSAAAALPQELDERLKYDVRVEIGRLSISHTVTGDRIA